jgi:5-methylcytosine-specific restriction endonuclease McrA
MTEPAPLNLEYVDQGARSFPSSWRDAAIRILYNEEAGGVLCLGCSTYMVGRKELRRLQGDHVVPWSKGGLTNWENFQLLCPGCNLDKSNSM